MEEKKTTEEVVETSEPENVDYINAIKDLKANTVSKEDYQKLQAENKKLLQSLLNGEEVEGAQDVEKTDIDTLRKELFNQHAEMTNLEYVTKAIQLRDALLEAGKPDPFLPYGHNIAPTAQDVEAANRVAEGLKSCIEYANGNSDIFTAELQRIMIDTAPVRKRR